MAGIKRLADMLGQSPRMNGRGGIKVGVEAVKAAFFDRAVVINALDKAERRFMTKFGAYVRSDAMKSMRTVRSGRPSRPGSPPNAHVGYLKKFMYFSYDARKHEVVIGPVRLPRTRYAVPGLHEHGGTVVSRKTRRVVNYPPRPYMKPALDKNLIRVEELRYSVEGLRYSIRK